MPATAARPTALAPSLSPTAYTDEESRVLAGLQTMTYEQLHQTTGWSRGRIYGLAVRAGARKTEQRIRERRRDREARQRAFFEATLESTATADVLDFFEGLPDASIALHCTSVPYNLGKPYGASADRDAPGADSSRTLFFTGWLCQIISEMSRTLIDGGVVFLQVGATRDWQDQLMPMDVLLYEPLRQAGLTFQSRVCWTIPHGLTPSTRLAERHETALVFSKGERPRTFNPTPARTPQKQPGKRAFKGPNKGELSGSPLGAWPTNVWADIGTVQHSHPEAAFGSHPAQYPSALAERAVLLYTAPGDVVCDAFAGSGSTQVAAVRTHRAFIGADLFYEDVRAKRLAATRPNTSSPLPGVSDDTMAVWQAEARRVEVPDANTPQFDLLR